ncbi:MAG: hypothetical protein A2X77_00295 [Gammaproteobacteria bacterium GWE2_42_36]|nr:MAG: hypothetical protein A2X77_00295 [Gammaproteobacteria bacterium GWE2_42_36]HCU05255.1 hypothetical protein [Coxiellaceae bacterium]
MKNLRVQQIGFTLIEVLVAIALLMIVLVTFMDYQFAALKIAQQSYFQIIAAEQLQGLVMLLRAFPDNNTAVIQSWKSEVSRQLPDFQFDLSGDGNPFAAAIFWRAREMSTWRCDDPVQLNRSCFMLRMTT